MFIIMTTPYHYIVIRMALTTTVLSLVAVSLLFLSGSRLFYEQYYGEQNCEMTYMYLYPQYQVHSRTERVPCLLSDVCGIGPPEHCQIEVN